MTGSGGAGNDTLTGGGSSETFLGGSGNDTINPGGGIDVVSGDDGDDQVNVRDSTADLARGGDGNDSVVADAGQLDILDGFETVDRTPNATPPPIATPHATGDHPRRHGQGEEGHSVDQGELPGDGARQLHRLARSCARPGRVKLAGLKVILQLGSARYNIAPGASKTVKVKLAKGSRRLADRNGRLKVLAVASTGAAGQIAQSSQRLTLALGAATKTRG